MHAWSKLGSEAIGDFRIFKLLRERFVSPRTGAEVGAVVVQSRDWVNVVALTDDAQVVLIRQFRFGTEKPTLEIPGGMVDAGESPLRAAQRELLEETGYRAATWLELGAIEPNPAFMRNRLHCFVARGCERVADQHQDPGEAITVELRAWREVEGLVTCGEIRHALVIVAFHLFLLRQAGRSVVEQP